ncbi:hypothetical protein CYMTET_29136 [Cymbomonas tetramitiformis]|uniref:galactinol--sucrose galactosyltransferase n=1 Tax=Cymbomonas tetramitiformis TaxID=36881 RepID=A0AAE0KV84_9CHLO|nr:hypothetical protein CYMTET_29136 [Cymbomonas tetramitiformis]
MSALSFSQLLPHVRQGYNHKNNRQSRVISRPGLFRYRLSSLLRSKHSAVVPARRRLVNCNARQRTVTGIEVSPEVSHGVLSLETSAEDLDASLIALKLTDDCVATADGIKILEKVNSSVFESPTTSTEKGLVLGLDTEDARASSSAELQLGHLACERLVACARCKLWWMTPSWGTAAKDIPPETQFLLLELAEGGPYAVLMTLLDQGKWRATLIPPKEGSDDQALGIRMDSGDGVVRTSRFTTALYALAGHDPYLLVEEGMRVAASLSGTAQPLSTKQLPPSIDVFGWCTWDAFYSAVSAADVVQGVKALHEAGVPPKFVIIDDGWQCTALDPQ